jgi:hypothetical protein
MSDEIFFASVKYGDMKGTAEADVADHVGPSGWLLQNGYMEDGEFVVGIQLSVGESYGVYKDPTAVEFLITRGQHDSVHAQINAGHLLAVRSVTVDIPIVEFLGWFKRFSLSLSPHGMLEGRSFQRTDVERS